MALLVAMMLACGGEVPETDPAPEGVAEEVEASAEAPTRRKRKPSPEDFGSDELLIPLLRFPSDAQPVSIEGLRRGAVDGEYEVDPAGFAWAGPKIRDGRFRFQQRGLRRATLNIEGRAACDRLIAAIEEPHGPPQETRCAERIWQTSHFAVRYLERPNHATCSVLILVDGAFPNLDPEPPALDASGALGLPLGAPIADFPDLSPTEERLQVHARAVGDEVLRGVSTYAPTWTFFDGHLEEVTVRANEDDCSALRERLVSTYGPGVEAATTPTDLNWVGCEVALEYRYSAPLQACRATARSVSHFFDRVAWQTRAEQRGVVAGRSAIRQHVTRSGDTITLGAGLPAWLEEDPDRAQAPYTRRLVSATGGNPGGLRILDVAPDGLMHVVGFRDRDLVFDINGVAPESYVPVEGEEVLTMRYRRGADEGRIVLAFEEGVLPALRQLWGQFP